MLDWMTPITLRSIKQLHSLPTLITFGNHYKQCVNNFGFILDFYLSLNYKVYTIARTCCIELRHLVSSRRYLTNTATDILVSGFILSIIDYCNSLLVGSTHEVTSQLQQIPVTELQINFQHVAFLPSRASYNSTFLMHCDRCECLGTTTCLRTVVNGNQEHAPCNTPSL